MGLGNYCTTADHTNCIKWEISADPIDPIRSTGRLLNALVNHVETKQHNERIKASYKINDQIWKSASQNPASENSRKTETSDYYGASSKVQGAEMPVNFKRWFWWCKQPGSTCCPTDFIPSTSNSWICQILAHVLAFFCPLWAKCSCGQFAVVRKYQVNKQQPRSRPENQKIQLAAGKTRTLKKPSVGLFNTRACT